MAYHSVQYFLLFLPAVWLVWAAAPKKWRPGVLLAASLYFYWRSSGFAVVWLLGLSALVWVLGLAIHRADGLFAAARGALDPPARKALKKQAAALKKPLLGLGVAVLLGVRFRVKYIHFVLDPLSGWLAANRPWWPQLTLSPLAQPLGISFFSLMAISYLVDVYRGTAQPAARYWQVLSYLSFWPHVVEGPFDRWGAVSAPLLDPPGPDYRALTFGAQRIVWGLFKKIVIADRANMYVKAVFDDWTQYSGLPILLGVLLYTLQLYAEFSGCMDIALGSAQSFGVELAENFRQPFFARSVGEFWRRWHITLGAWLREYVFQPVIVSRPMVRFGKWCKMHLGAGAGRRLPVWAGLLLTWLLIGLWHGAGTIYLYYGLYYFALQALGDAAEPWLLRLLPRLPAWRQTRPWQLWQTARTFVLVNFGMMMFRSHGMRSVFQMLRSLAVPYAGGLLIKLDARDAAVLAVGAALMLAVDLLHERGVHLREALARRPLPLRWAVYIGAVVVTMLLGAYGDNYDPAGFIYAQF